jgi:prevent-host-death family protein
MAHGDGVGLILTSRFTLSHSDVIRRAGRAAPLPRGTDRSRPALKVSVGDLAYVTSHDHNEVMTKVGIADLKARLSEHLRRVRGGRTITIVDRGTPVAQIIPFERDTALGMRRATRKPAELRLPSPPANATDSLAVLLRDRASR